MKNYKQIWDNLSTNFADAAHFVGYEGDEDEIRANGGQTAAFLRDVLQIGPQDRVLEIGCGIARIGRELAPFCKEWHGADIAGNMLKHAARRTEGLPNVSLHELPESNLDIFAGGYFDVVYSSIVFMHLDKYEMFRYIEDAYRILAPGGRVYFDTYNLLAPEAWKQFEDIVRAYPDGKRPGHVSQFSTPQELQKFMQEAAFDQIHIDDRNPQLIVALGHKTAANESSTHAQRPQSALKPTRATPTTSTSTTPASEQHNDESEHTWKKLNDNLRAKQSYIQELESTLAAKNNHIERIERALHNQQRALESPLVRLALKLTRQR